MHVGVQRKVCADRRSLHRADAAQSHCKCCHEHLHAVQDELILLHKPGCHWTFLQQ